ncbi:MAG: MFS transporter [Acutalibacteraceae bacterium]
MQKIKDNYKYTLSACYIGYVTQAIVNNFAPLLFVCFNREFNISFDKIALIVSLNFTVQLIVDFLSAHIIDKIGYRKMIVSAHVFCALGLAGFGIFPFIMPSHYIGILAATVINAIGGGLIEVLVSPIAQACPVDSKSSAMSLLHSFYCWGHIFVVVVSTVFFRFAGVSMWRWLALVWAVIPLLNSVLFSKVNIYPLIAEDESGMKVRELFKSGTFWLLLILMVCAGASEQSVSQWVSAFAEDELGVSKSIGDLAGPCSFALFMGLSRVISSAATKKIDLKKIMLFCAALCCASYLMASLGQNAVVSLIGCSLCGFAVGIMWPGTFSLAAELLPKGSTAMFALLALGGDLGCGLGPYVVGVVSDSHGDSIKTGILYSIVFPVLLVLLLISTLLKKSPKKI